jgi:hypothetical protein
MAAVPGRRTVRRDDDPDDPDFRGTPRQEDDSDDSYDEESIARSLTPPSTYYITSAEAERVTDEYLTIRVNRIQQEAPGTRGALVVSILSTAAMGVILTVSQTYWAILPAALSVTTAAAGILLRFRRNA